MANIGAVASYVLDLCGTMTTMKLQKLAYYSQAQQLGTKGIPLFSEDFQAWRAGPVCIELFREHRGKFIIRQHELKADGTLTHDEQKLVEKVCNTFNHFNGEELSRRTHSEEPWKIARGNLAPDQPSGAIITKESMLQYYSQHLPVAEGAQA